MNEHHPAVAPPAPIDDLVRSLSDLLAAPGDGFDALARRAATAMALGELINVHPLIDSGTSPDVEHDGGRDVEAVWRRLDHALQQAIEMSTEPSALCALGRVADVLSDVRSVR